MYDAASSEAVQKYFGSLANEWDDRYRRSRLFRQRYEEFRKLISSRGRRDARALDYGCGTGVLTALLAESFGEVVATDSSKEMSQVAMKRFADHPSVVVTDLESAHQRCFDMILCSSVIEYVPNDREFVLDIASRLRPGGELIATFPNRYAPLQFTNRQFISRFSRNSYSRYQQRTYTKSGTRRLLSAAGFSVSSIYSSVGIPGLRAAGLGELIFCLARMERRDDVP